MIADKSLPQAIDEDVKKGRVMCPYCGVGCLLDVKTQQNQVLELRGAIDSSSNQGLLCPKGALLGSVLDLSGRLLKPQVRLNGRLEDSSWDKVLPEVAQKLTAIIDKYGADSVAMYGSGQLDTESWYLANKLFKGYLGSNHVESNSRLCMASAVVAYTTMLGSDAPPTCYEDIDHADCIFVAGSNMADAHPVTFQLIKRQRAKNPDLKLIVVDPRMTNTAKAADIYVPVKAGGDIALFHAIGRILLDEGAIDESFIRDFSSGFEEYAALLSSYDLEDLAAEAGLELAQIRQVADAFRNARNLLSFYCMGLGQSHVGTAKNQALINLHLLLGQIGKVGAGPFSLTGQPNAMGGRELGGLAHLLPGQRQIENESHRQEVESYWGLPEGSIHPKRGLSAVEIFKAIDEGRIKAIWIAATNPLVSMPNLPLVRRALEKAELVIVQDCFETETSVVADYVLPVAQWIERENTMTNSERMVTRNPKLSPAPGVAMPDWWVFAQVGQSMGFEGFNFVNNGQIWDEFRGLTKGRPCDMTGMTNERLKTTSLQWPCPSEDHAGTQRRYLDRRFATPDKKAKFIACQHKGPAEDVSQAYPFVLTTGRLASQWHTMTRTGKIDKLFKQASTPYMEMHSADGEALGIEENDCVRVSSLRGSIQIEVRLTGRIRRGTVFMPFHWGDFYALGQVTNTLTHDAIDPLSKEPEYKACAVKIERLIEREGTITKEEA
jgi:ferredoxin-nitrate reductase